MAAGAGGRQGRYGGWYTTTKAVYAVAKEHGIEMPIVEAIHGVLYEGEQAMPTLDRLMRRNKKHENEQEWFQETRN